MNPLFDQSSQELANFEKSAKKLIESLHPRLQKSFPSKGAQKSFIDALGYSFLDGGKRMRPLLCFQVAHMLKLDSNRVMGAALASELVHAHSLIHDDLPCMDDSNLRRNKPSHHIVYGEAQALMSGSFLLAEAFAVLAQTYEGNVFSTLASNLSHFTQCMIWGQTMELSLSSFSEEQILLIYELKTGALMAFTALAPAVIQNLSPEKKEALKKFAIQLGIAFQLKDDLLGLGEKESSIYTQQYGANSCQKKLHDFSDLAQKSLAPFKKSAKNLIQLIEYNANRNH